MGLIEYIANFFVADNLQAVSHICQCMIRIIIATLLTDLMPYGLPSLAANNVLSFWPEVVYSTPWPNVEYYAFTAGL